MHRRAPSPLPERSEPAAPAGERVDWSEGRAPRWVSYACCALVWPALLIGARAYRAERSCFLPRAHAPRTSREQFGIDGLREVTFASANGDELRGFYAPPRHGAAVILTHGSSGERSDLADEARILAGAEFGVLAFDWPGHGESRGKIEWAGAERAALSAAFDWLANEPEVEPRRIGVFGFSMGGYIVAQVAAADARFRAVALAGTPHDSREHTLWEYRRFGRIAQWPALLALHRSGAELDRALPEQLVAQIAPRPLLLINGADDPSVPPWMVERLFSAAREPKRRLTVPGAGHGGYFAAAGAEYAKALCDFFAVLLTP